MTITMYDTITVDTVPANPPAVAGYVGGSWPTFAGLVAKFPNAKHLSIAVNAGERARCLDVEPGDATNAQAPGWFKTLADKSQGLPVLYTSASNVQALVNTMAAAGVPRSAYLIWSAHYTYKDHICSPGTCGYPQADGTQWTDKALGRNLDQSTVSHAFFGTGPTLADTAHYDWYDATPRFNGAFVERDTVVKYDRLRSTLTPTRQPRGTVLAVYRLRVICGMFAARVWAVAHVPGKGGFGADHRGWRWQQLRHRMLGQRVV